MSESPEQQEYAPPFSLRLTFEERATLQQEAGHLPLGTYLRIKLLELPSPRKRTYRQPVKDEQTLAELLAMLGTSRIPNNLNQIAKAVHSGSLPVTPETEQAIIEACKDVREMRSDLVKALGLTPGQQ